MRERFYGDSFSHLAFQVILDTTFLLFENSNFKPGDIETEGPLLSKG